MKYLLTSVLLSSLLFSSVHAVEVNFENTGLLNLSSSFQGADILNANQNLSAVGESFFGIDVSFSGGVLLQDPVMGSTINNINCPTCGSVFYGSGLSLTTGVIIDDVDINGVNQYLSPTISVDIDPSEQITRVSGLLLSGLNTSLIGPMTTTEYVISFLGEGGALFPDQLMIEAGYNPAEFIPEEFLFDTNDIVGSQQNAIITGFTITALGIDFPSGSNSGLPDLPVEFNEREWDFLIDSVSFESNIAPVPLPAGLPLFISALLGGFVIARPRKPSDSK